MRKLQSQEEGQRVVGEWRSPGAKALDSHRLEEKDNSVRKEQGKESTRIHIRESRCWCRVCSSCAPRLGMRVRGALLRTQDSWEIPYLFTLTVDRSKFASPQAAYEHIKQGRYIPRLLTALNLVRWVHVLEFQMETWDEKGRGWPHWHLLIDLAAVKGYVNLKKAWALWRDTWGLGGLDLRMRKRMKDQSPESAMRYITKYLVKVPKEGWPDWVLEKRNIRFVQASRSIGALLYRKPAFTEADVEQDQVEEIVAEDEEVTDREPKTMKERVSSCGHKSSLLYEDTAGKYTYAGTVGVRPAQLALRASEGHWDGIQTRIVEDGFGGSKLQVSITVRWYETVKEVVERIENLAREVEEKKVGMPVKVHEDLSTLEPSEVSE